MCLGVEMSRVRSKVRNEDLLDMSCTDLSLAVAPIYDTATLSPPSGT